MAKKRILKKQKIEGALNFKSIGQGRVNFNMADEGQLSNLGISLPIDLFPNDFDPTTDTVEGSYVMEFTVTRK